MEESAKHEGEDRDAQNGPAQDPEMKRGAKGPAPQRNEDVLDENAAPGMKMRGVAAEDAHEQDDAERALDAHGEQVGERDRGGHLLASLRIGDLVKVPPGPPERPRRCGDR